MYAILRPTIEWIKDDWQSHKLRFCLEVFAWILSIGCAVTMALTVPNPPLKFLYFPWVLSTALYTGCAFSRRSFGMLANYLLLFLIDGTALARMWL